MENATWFTCGCEYPEYEVTAFALNRYGFPIFSSPVGKYRFSYCIYHGGGVG